jgi:prepilin-type N-terminal cleavage/methylation domain-containing protein
MNWKLEIGNWKLPRPGFTLMEVLVTLAVVLILISTLMGVGSRVKERAAIGLTKGMLETLTTALEQYYSDFGTFPFDTDTSVPEDGVLDAYLTADLQNDLKGLVSSGLLEEQDGSSPPVTISTASSASLFWFLDRNPASRAIVEDVPQRLMTNKDANGTAVKINIGGKDYDLPRYIDPWKTSIRYVYLPGTAIPVLTSAGPDKIFDTPDDITSK